MTKIAFALTMLIRVSCHYSRPPLVVEHGSQTNFCNRNELLGIHYIKIIIFIKIIII
jgi:hypothetical protein